jgi:hypothetical protein
MLMLVLTGDKSRLVCLRESRQGQTDAPASQLSHAAALAGAVAWLKNNGERSVEQRVVSFIKYTYILNLKYMQSRKVSHPLM